MLTVAAAQVEPVPLDIVANVAEAARIVAAAGAELVVFPELSLTGYELPAIGADPGELSLHPDDDRLAPLRAACAAAGCVAVVGAPVPSPRGLLLGALVVTPDGRAPLVYGKQQVDDDEIAVFVAGEGPMVVDVGDHRVGLTLCVEVRDPALAAASRALGAEIYAAGAIFKTGTEEEMAQELAARASETGMWVVGAQVSGSSGSLQAAGGSGVWGPDGQVLSRLGAEAPALATAIVAG